MELKANLSIISFNCKGHSMDHIDDIKQLSSIYDVILLQEYWYHESVLASQWNNMHVYGSSGMEPSTLLIGRPHRGCAILISGRLKCKFTPLPVSKRCFAGILELHDR